VTISRLQLFCIALVVYCSVMWMAGCAGSRWRAGLETIIVSVQQWHHTLISNSGCIKHWNISCWSLRLWYNEVQM